jgi:hypothetical protein
VTQLWVRPWPEEIRLWRYRSEHTNAIVALVGEINSPPSADCDTGGEGDFRGQRWSAVAAEPAHSGARNRMDETR